MLRQEEVIVNYEPYTISDYVRELARGGVEPRMICWRLKLKEETVLRWVAEDPNNL